MKEFILTFVILAAVLYAAAAALYLLGVKSRAAAKAAVAAFLGGFAVNILAMVARSLLIQRLPLANVADFVLLFAAFVALLYLFIEYKNKSAATGAAACIIASLLLWVVILGMPNQLQQAQPLSPVLKSPLLAIHVVTAALSYAGFAVAAGSAIIQLKKASSDISEKKVYGIVAASFVMLTFTIIIGAVWAEQAWGTYWSWDPKETWALITWIIYAIYLHLHRLKKWQGKRANILVIVGFALVLFTFFGVNFLFAGLHSY